MNEDLAITGLCWFHGTREKWEAEGQAKEWHTNSAATWGEYRLEANEEARRVLESLPGNTAIVFLEYATPRTWWRTQQQGRKWQDRIDFSTMKAYAGERGIMLAAQRKDVPVRPNRDQEFMARHPWLHVFWVIWLIIQVVRLISCALGGSDA